MVILRGPDPSLPSYNAGHVTDRNHLTRLRDDGVIAMVSIFLSHDSSLVLTYFYNPCTQGCRPADRESLLSVRPYLSSCLYSSRVAFTLPNLRSLNLSLPFPPSFPPTPLPPSSSLPSVSHPLPSHLQSLPPPAPPSRPPFPFPFPCSHSLVLYPTLTIYSPSFALGGIERGVAYLPATSVIQLTAIYQVFNNCCGDGQCGQEIML